MKRILGLVLLLAACQEAETSAELPTGDADTCNAARYAALIGTSADAVSFPDDQRFRIIGPNTAVTLDFIETRLNVRTDEAGTILSLSCG